MTDIPRKYVINENNKRVAVQLDISVFDKVEETLENYALVELIKQTGPEERFSVEDAKAYYQKLEKAE